MKRKIKHKRCSGLENPNGTPAIWSASHDSLSPDHDAAGRQTVNLVIGVKRLWQAFKEADREVVRSDTQLEYLLPWLTSSSPSDRTRSCPPLRHPLLSRIRGTSHIKQIFAGCWVISSSSVLCWCPRPAVFLRWWLLVSCTRCSRHA